jgi:two-component system, OmpR family, response regulator VicR
MKKPYKILLADDDLVFREALEFRLRKDGFEVVCASNGNEGIELLVAERPELVVTDVLMPFMNGLEILKVAKTGVGNNTPVIILTSIGLEATMTEAFRLGVDDFVTKPFNPTELMLRIHKIIRQRLQFSKGPQLR